MQDKNRHLEILQALAAVTAPVTGEIFPADSPYNQPQIIRALFFAINELEAIAEKGNQDLAWDEEEDALIAERFGNGSKITQLAKLHSRTYGAIKARLIKLKLLQKNKARQFLNCRALLSKLHFGLSVSLRPVRENIKFTNLICQQFPFQNNQL